MRTAFAAALLLGILGMSACASSSFAGIPLAGGAADPELQSLARRAQAGDKHAQLELGIRYEQGLGVGIDLARAERLYRRAATATGGTRLVCIPASGRHGPASTVPLSGRRVEGLLEAATRLAALLRSRRGR